MARKKNPLDRLVKGRAGYALNQHAPVMGDRRTRRNRDRSAQRRRAIAEGAS